MNYIEEAIEVNSEYGRKYLELVSKGDYGDNLEVHHIVPVAYFADVLGIKECRTSKSPDMAKENLVSLSKGRHVLAHFYLAKCARKCIAVQMRNAFCLTYQTTDFSSVTEKDVLTRIDEIDREYRKMKSMKKEHKDGIEIRRTKTCVSMNKWEDGKPVGISMKWDTDGKIREVEDHKSGITIQNIVMGGIPRLRVFIKADGVENTRMVNGKHMLAQVENDFCIEIHALGWAGMTLYNSVPYRGFGASMFWGTESSRDIDGGVGNDDFWEQVKNFLSKKNRQCLSTVILSIRRYASMVSMEMSLKTNHLLRLLEDCAVDAERLPTFELPEFPTAA